MSDNRILTDPNEIIEQARLVYKRRVERDAEQEAQAKQALAAARQAYAEAIYRPLLDMNLSPEAQATLNIAVAFKVKGDRGDIEQTTEAYVTFKLTDDIHGTIEFMPKQGATYATNHKERPAKWTVRVKRSVYDDIVWWAEGETSLMSALVLAIGKRAEQIEADRAEHEARRRQEAENNRRYMEREAQRKAQAVAKWTADRELAQREDAEIRPILKELADTLIAQADAAFRPFTLYSVTWQTGWVPRLDDEEGGYAATESGYALTDTPNEQGYLRVYVARQGWKTLRVNWTTAVWQKLDFQKIDDVPYELRQQASLHVKGVRISTISRDVDDKPFGPETYFMYHDETTYRRSFNKWGLVKGLAEAVELPPAPSIVHDVRKNPDQPTYYSSSDGDDD